MSKIVSVKNHFTIFQNGHIKDISFQEWIDIKGIDIKPVIGDMPIVSISVPVPSKMNFPIWNGPKGKFIGTANVKPESFSNGAVVPWIGKEVQFIGVIGQSTVKGAKCVATVVMIKKIKGIVKAIPVKDVMIFCDKMVGGDIASWKSMSFGSAIAFKATPVVVFKAAQKKHDVSFAMIHSIKPMGGF